MTHFISLLLALSLLAPLAAQASAWKVDPERVDLGTHQQEKQARGSVTITNTGNRPLEITDVSADCSCTAAEPEKKLLAPGESTAINVAFETRQYNGELHRRVLVQTDAGEIVIPVLVRVSAYPDWLVTPSPLFLKPSSRLETAEASALVQSLAATPARIENVSATVPWLQATLEPDQGPAASTLHQPAASKPGSYTIKITKTTAAPAGYHAVKLQIATNDPRSPLLEIPLYVSVQSSIKVSPSPLVLPPVKIGEPAVLRGTLRGLPPDQPIALQVTAGSVVRDPEITASGECGFELTQRPEIVGTSTQLLRVIVGGQIELEVPLILRAQP